MTHPHDSFDGFPRPGTSEDSSTDPVDSALDRPDVVAALQEYRAQGMAGARPDRDRLFASFPELASELRGCLEVLDFLQAAAAELSVDTSMDHVADGSGPTEGPPPPEPLPAPIQLGDFRLGREVGRGGMGIVYEAFQVGLGRRVALKILPIADKLDPRRLRRFNNEAAAAAFLRHPHIVAIHFVGCDQGVHYYTMDFVDGCNLADVIRHCRRLQCQESSSPSADGAQTTPYEPLPLGQAKIPDDLGWLQDNGWVPGTAGFFRKVARLGIQAAHALEHAREQGVIHRDIKPGNLLLDHQDNLYVTDFGLAQIMESSRMTRTGDFVGTVCYTSPEQAFPGKLVVDHRTDIYSLGVTLYELLTLRSVVDGADPRDILRQITLEEPTPPRRINKAIPADLETIVLKTMNKNREERYACAQELADDLTCFLEFRPIQARPATLLVHLQRWARRHQPLVWSVGMSAVLLLVMALVFLSVSISMIKQEREQAEQQRDDAEQAREDAVAYLQTARQAIHQLLTRVSEDRLSVIPQMEQVRRDLLEEALAFYEGLRQINANDRGLRQDIAQARGRLGMVLWKMGENDKAEACLRDAIAQLDQLASEERLDPELAMTQIRFAHCLGWLLGAQPQRFSERTRVREQTLQLAEKLVADHPRNLRHDNILADASIELGNARRDDQPEVAEKLFHRAIDLMGQPGGNRHAWARAHLALGELQARQERWQEAEQTLTRALAQFERLVKEFPRLWQCQERCGDVSYQLGRIQAITGRPEEAKASHRRAFATFEKLHREYPSFPTYHDGAALAGSALLMLQGPGKPTEDVAKLHAAFVKLRPGHLDAIAEVAWALACCPIRAWRNPRQALELARNVVQKNSRSRVAWRALALAQVGLGEPRAAIDTLNKARARNPGDDAFLGFALAIAHADAGDLDRARQQYREAVRWMDHHRPRDCELQVLRNEAERRLPENK